MKELINYINAGTSGITIVTHEENRVEADVFRIAKQLGFRFFVWSCTEGLAEVRETGTRQFIGDTQDPSVMLDKFNTTTIPPRSIVLARDFHAWTADGNPMLARKLRDVIAIGKSSNRVLILCGCEPCLPATAEKEMVRIDFKLPGKVELLAILKASADAAKTKLTKPELEPLVAAASGLTSAEADNAFALSWAETGRFDPAVIQREKSQAVKKAGLLEIVEGTVTLKDIGGLTYLKEDLTEKRNLFSAEAKEYGLPTPQAMLVVGQPGTGKSLTASATALTFNLPLLRLEVGRLFGSLVGETESNWRKAFAAVKAIAPCILWIDEVEGLFAGGGGQSTDSGTTQRVIKAILQDMQFNGDGIFFMFTSNDIDKLPDPLIDRCQVWSVDLPTKAERADVWRIQIAKRKRSPQAFNLDELAEITEGFSGRQIEHVWIKAMTHAFNDGKRQPVMSDIVLAASRTVPTSVTMADQIAARRQRLASKAQPASAPEATETVQVGGRKFV